MTNKDVFYCKKCGSKGEQYFDWNGNCLVCEDENDQ